MLAAGILLAACTSAVGTGGGPPPPVTPTPAAAASAPLSVPEGALAVARGVVVEAAGLSWSASRVVLAGTPGAPERLTAEAPSARIYAGGVPLFVTSAASDWDLAGNIATFEGDVKVVRGEAEVRCSTLRVRWETRGSARVVTEIVASGGVDVRVGTRRAEAREARLEGASGAITLTGNARLREGANALEGATVTFFPDEDRARCVGASGAPCRLIVVGEPPPSSAGGATTSGRPTRDTVPAGEVSGEALRRGGPPPPQAAEPPP